MIADQKEVAVYVGPRSWRCWRTRRLLAPRLSFRCDRHQRRRSTTLLADSLHWAQDAALRFR
jgi:hypothetical protein